MLKRFDRYWIALVMLLSIAALPVRIHASSATVVFSEIAWAGSSISSSDEWIELTNVSETSIDLSNWKISGAGSSGKDLLLPEGSVVEPHSTYLISNYENSNENAAFNTISNYVTSTVSLSNSGLYLYLYDDAGSLVDVAGDGSAPFTGRSGSTADSNDGRYASMVRVDGLTDGSLLESWADAETSSGFKEGIQDYGSPGSVLFASSQPAETTQETTEQEIVVEEVNVVEEVVPLEEDPNKEITEQESVSPEPTVSETSNSSEESTSSEILVINEFVVDPNEDQTEWIELVNVSDQSIDLTLWTVEDESGKQTVLEGSLESHGYLLIDSPVGKLNNDTDTIILKNPEAVVIDSVTYGTEELEAPKDGASLARNSSGIFELTYTSTPASENIFSSEPSEPVQEPVEETQVEGEIVEDTQVVAESETAVASEEEQTSATAENSAESVTESTTTQESAESSSSQTSTTTQESLPTGTILINEFVADPLEGEAEWIELVNTSQNAVTLTGWTLEDASGKSTDLSSVTIDGSSYFVIESPKGKLNNDGDTIILKNSNGTMIETVVYGTDAYPVPKDGMSLARNGQIFELTQQTTPGSANLIFIALEETDLEQETPSVQEESEEESSQPSEESSSESPTTLIKTIRFSKLYPNTSGSDETEEYIELFNTGTETIDLRDWSIEDGSTDRYTITQSLVVSPQTSVQLLRPQTSLALNNSGDTLELIAPDSEVVDKVTYGNAAKGAVYQFKNGSWSWSQAKTATSVTPVSSTQSSSIKSSTVSASFASYSYTSTNAFITIEQARQKKDGEMVKVKGVVTATPGTFGTQISYVMDETGGIQVYLYDGSYPALAVGDAVELTGELSTSHGERRIKLDQGTDLRMSSETFSTQPTFYPVTDIEEPLVGQLISTKGQIQSKSATKLVIEQFGATLVIYLKSNPVIDPNQFERGDLITVTGVLTQYDGELRIRPRSSEDVKVDETAQVVTASTQISDQTPTQESQAGMILLLSTIAGIGLLAVWHYRPRKQLAVTA